MAILFTIAEKQKQLKCALTKEWITNVYAYSRILFTHKKGVLMRATTRMNLENILLHERSQIQIATYCMTPFI